jgi:hypothetical protein
MSLHIMVAFSTIIFSFSECIKALLWHLQCEKCLRNTIMHEKVTTQNGFTIESAESNFIVIWINFHPGWGHNRTLSFRELNKGTKQKSGLEHYSRPRSQRTLTRHPKTWVASHA